MVLIFYIFYGKTLIISNLNASCEGFYKNNIQYCLNEMILSDEDLRLEDWKMPNDRVKYLDDTVMRTRLQGLPIATSIQAAAFTTLGAKIEDTTVGLTNVLSVGDFDFAVFQLILGAGLAHLIPVLLLDILHYRLLLVAAEHTTDIEDKYFKDKLSITSKLHTASTQICTQWERI